MGQHKLKERQLLASGQMHVTFNFEAPQFHPLESDVAACRDEAGNPCPSAALRARCVKGTMIHAAVRRYERGMSATVSAMWAKWTEAMEWPEPTVSVTLEMTRWLLELLSSDATLMAPNFALYRYALIAYLTTLESEGDSPCEPSLSCASGSV